MKNAAAEISLDKLVSPNNNVNTHLDRAAMTMTILLVNVPVCTIMLVSQWSNTDRPIINMLKRKDN